MKKWCLLTVFLMIVTGLMVQLPLAAGGDLQGAAIAGALALGIWVAIWVIRYIIKELGK